MSTALLDVETRDRLMTASENFVTEQVNAGKSEIGLYPATSEKAQADYAA